MNLLSILCRPGYGLDDAMNGSWRIVATARIAAIGIAIAIVFCFIIGVFFTIHDSGRSQGDKDIKIPKEERKKKKEKK